MHDATVDDPAYAFALSRLSGSGGEDAHAAEPTRVPGRSVTLVTGDRVAE